MSTIKLLPVIFRISAGEVTAIFPTEPCNMNGDVTCYAHIGQHGGASWSWYRSTRKATPDQFAALYKELRGIYERDGDCILQICERVTQDHKRRFYAEVRRLRKGES